MVGEPSGGKLEEVVGRGSGRWLRMNKKIKQNNPRFLSVIIFRRCDTFARGFRANTHTQRVHTTAFHVPPVLAAMNNGHGGGKNYANYGCGGGVGRVCGIPRRRKGAPSTRSPR